MKYGNLPSLIFGKTELPMHVFFYIYIYINKYINICVYMYNSENLKLFISLLIVSRYL